MQSGFALTGKVEAESKQEFKTAELRLNIPPLHTVLRPTSADPNASELLLKLDIPQGKSTLSLSYELPSPSARPTCVFALDSIPAVFGITQDAFLVFSANLFALMGLRQLYFLLGHLIDRLAYLTYGITVILVFIAVKLVLHALHGNDVFFINGGKPLAWAPEIGTFTSLAVISLALAVSVGASLIKLGSTHTSNIRNTRHFLTPEAGSRRGPREAVIVTRRVESPRRPLLLPRFSRWHLGAPRAHHPNCRDWLRGRSDVRACRDAERMFVFGGRRDQHARKRQGDDALHRDENGELHSQVVHHLGQPAQAVQGDFPVPARAERVVLAEHHDGEPEAGAEHQQHPDAIGDYWTNKSGWSVSNSTAPDGTPTMSIVSSSGLQLHRRIRARSRLHRYRAV